MLVTAGRVGIHEEKQVKIPSGEPKRVGVTHTEKGKLTWFKMKRRRYKVCLQYATLESSGVDLNLEITFCKVESPKMCL